MLWNICESEALQIYLHVVAVNRGGSSESESEQP